MLAGFELTPTVPRTTSSSPARFAGRPDLHRHHRARRQRGANEPESRNRVLSTSGGPEPAAGRFCFVAARGATARLLLAKLVGAKQNCGGLHRGLEPTRSPIADARALRRSSPGGCNSCNGPRGIADQRKSQVSPRSRQLPPAQPPRDRATPGSSCASSEPLGAARPSRASRRSCPRVGRRRAGGRDRGCSIPSRSRPPCHPSTGRC